MSAIPFTPFGDRGELRYYEHGILPHWRQDSCTYFVTFRLADSLPAPIIRELAEERRRWLKAHGIPPDAPDWKRQLADLPIEKRREFEKRIGAQLNEQLDKGCGSCLLREPAIAEIVAGGLNHFHGERLWTGDYVIMPNHVHALLTPIHPHALEHILKSVKGYTARVINRSTINEGQLWQRQSYDHIVRDAAQLAAFQNYIADNPAKAGLPEGSCIRHTAEYDLSQCGP